MDRIGPERPARLRGRRLAAALAALLCTAAGAHALAARPVDAQAPADVAVVILQRGAPGPDGTLAGVAFQGETTSEEAARKLGFRSVTSIVDVDCRARRQRILQLQEFEDHAFKGALRAILPNGQWLSPDRGDYTAGVISSVCGDPASLATAPSAPHKDPHSARRAAPSQPVGAEGAGPGEGWVALQLGAYATEAAARTRLRQAEPLPAGLSPLVRPMLVGDTHYYRALLTGFASRSQAAGYCSDRGLAKSDCWIH